MDDQNQSTSDNTLPIRYSLMMAGFETFGTTSSETKKERHQPTLVNIDASWRILDTSTSHSEVDEIVDSTLEHSHSRLHKNESFVADEGEDIKSNGDIHSSTTDSSGSISVSISSAASQPRQQDQQPQKSTSSSSFSSAEWDSSSSESTSVSSQPQHQLLGDSKGEGISDDSNSKHAGEKETGSAKMRRILYGSSASSFDDEYIPLHSWNSYSSNLKYEESNSNSRNRDYKSLGAEIGAGDRSDLAPVDERGENVKETLNVVSSPKNKERSDVPFSPSSGNGDLNKVNEEIAKLRDSFSSLGRVENDDAIEGKNSHRSNESSEIQSKQSQSRRESHQRTEVLSTHNEGGRAVSTTSPNVSLDSRSRSRSSTKPKPHTTSHGSISQSPSEKLDESHRSPQSFKNSYIGARARKGKIDSKESNGDAIAREKANSAMRMARSWDIPEDPLSFDSTDVNSSGKGGNEVERKESTKWAQTEEFEKMNYGVNDMTIDELDWKPPALTTFSRSNYDKSTTQHRKKVDPKARESTFGSKEGFRTSPIDKKFTKKVKKIDKSKIPAPVSEIIVRQPSDDDSTLGTEGTYLERFPKKKKRNKNKEKSTVNGVVPSSAASKTPKLVAVNETPEDRNSGGTEKYTSMVPITPAECIPKYTTVPTTPAEYIPKLPRTIEKNFPDEPKSSLQPRPDIANLGNNAVSGIKREFENHMSGGADPPGDTYLDSYYPRNSQQQQSQVALSDYARADSVDNVDHVDHADKNCISREPTTSIGDSITHGDETHQFILSSPMPVTSWVTSSMRGRGGGLDLDPTRTFINSLLTEKRSPQSMIDDRRLQEKPQTRQQSQIPVGLDREKASGRSGSEYSTSQSRDIGTADISESTSKNVSVLGEMPRSDCSTSQSQKFASLMKTHGEISRKIDGEISRTKYPQNTSQSQPLQDNEGREIQYGSNDEGDDSSDDSDSSPDSAAFAEHFPKGFERSSSFYGKAPKRFERSASFFGKAPKRVERSTSFYGKTPKRVERLASFYGKTPKRVERSASVYGKTPKRVERSASFYGKAPERADRSSSRKRSGKKSSVIAPLLWFFAVLIIATAIVVVVLWQLGIFNNDDEDSQQTIIVLPTPKPLPLVTQAPVTPPTKAPTVAPTKVESSTKLFNLIIEAYPQGQPALEDPNSPQAKALKWLDSSTNSGISVGHSILQRYALATVYYSTNGDDWIDNTGWLSEGDECNWMSTTAESICDELGKYTKLDLEENNLVGTLPAELGILSDTLRSINSRTNDLSGEIPSPMISELVNLEVLDLSSNSFSGGLSKQLFDATSLTRLSLFENNLSSSIPTELGQLTNLEVLDLGSNKLTSTIPATITNLSKLAGLSLFNNMLTGSVPAGLSGIESLNMLYIDSNKLEGPLPAEVCLLNIDEFWGDCEEIQCTCCTTCCSNNFGCFVV